MKPGAKLTRIAVGLSTCLVFVAVNEGAMARDRDGGGIVVRDHRTPPVIRDHRSPEQVVVRDHRTQPVIRDHRATPTVRNYRMPGGPQGGVSVTSSGNRRGGSPCIRSVFGGPCVNL